MSTAPTEARKCSYEYGEWHCPFDAEAGHDLCIFHLPMDKKQGREADFWRELACYLYAQMLAADNPEVKEFAGHLPSDHWLRADGSNWREYQDFAARTPPWRFTGFVFPATNRKHNFASFAFGEASFQDATFNAGAHFVNAKFSGRALFGDAKFSGNADFRGTTFGGEARFERTIFAGGADFWHARFYAAVSFERAEFHGEETSFEDADFSGPVLMRRTAIRGLLAFTYAYLHNQLLLDGAILDDKSRVLLWGLNFIHGLSDIVMEKEHLKGQIIEPAGQVVFRDISANMNRVSFLHTDILTDRLCVRFSNVKWQTDPKQFIFDALFALFEPDEWLTNTGLPGCAIDRLPELFFADRPAPAGGTPVQNAGWKAQQLGNCKLLVQQDVERIAREIRLSTEKYGSYSDAGDFHIAEMEYRRMQTPGFSFRRFLLAGYKRLSMYGEDPGLAARWLLAVMLAAALGYSLVGVAPLTACLYGIGGLIPGLVRATMVESPTAWLIAVMVSQSIVGTVVLSLLLLAIRRRFRR